MLSVEDIKDLGHSRKVSLMTKIGNGMAFYVVYIQNLILFESKIH